LSTFDGTAVLERRKKGLVVFTNGLRDLAGAVLIMQANEEGKEHPALVRKVVERCPESGVLLADRFSR
jgi:hypothetical protein